MARFMVESALFVWIIACTTYDYFGYKTLSLDYIQGVCILIRRYIPVTDSMGQIKKKCPVKVSL